MFVSQINSFFLNSLRHHSDVSTLVFFFLGCPANVSRATRPLFFLTTGCPIEVLVVSGNQATANFEHYDKLNLHEAHKTLRVPRVISRLVLLRIRSRDRHNTYKLTMSNVGSEESYFFIQNWIRQVLKVIHFSPFKILHFDCKSIDVTRCLTWWLRAWTTCGITESL